MKYINPFFVLFFLLCSGAKAQRDTAVYYLDSSLRVTDRLEAVCLEKAVHRDGLWYVTVTRLKDKSKVMTGSYKDKQLEVGEGLFEYFNKGFVILAGYYHDGAQSGIWKKWSNDSLLTDSVYFDGGDVVSAAKFQYHTNRGLWRYSLLTQMQEKITRVFDTLGVLESEGHFMDKNGEMFIYYPNHKVKTHSVYKDNQRTVYELFDEQGNKYTESEYLEMMKKKTASP